MKSYLRKKHTSHDLISSIELEDDKITTILNVAFYWKEKEYKIKIYVLMTTKMKNTITDNENNITGILWYNLSCSS